MQQPEEGIYYAAMKVAVAHMDKPMTEEYIKTREMPVSEVEPALPPEA